MQDVEITTAATDRRPVLPATLASALGLSVTESEELADEVGARLAADADLCGRPLWREEVTEKLTGPGRQNLLLSRWPIEGLPAVAVIDGGAVDVTTYEVTGSGRHALYRRSGWALSASRVDSYTGEPAFPSTRLHYEAGPYFGGFLMPGQVSTYAADIVVQAGGSTSYGEKPGWIRATDRSISLRFEVTAPVGAEAMDSTEPVWPTTVGDTVVSGAVTLTARAAFELPAVGSALLKLATSIAAGSKMLPNVKKETIRPGHELEYFGGDGVGNLAAGLRALR